MNFQYNDGGRAAAGFKGTARDCVARAVAIASGKPYLEVYADLSFGLRSQRRQKGAAFRAVSARDGVDTRFKWFRDYMVELGFEWTPTMFIGSGCKVHLRAEELPSGRLVLNCSRHVVAMIDGVIHDNHDPSRGGKRCIYGYWKMREA